MTNEELVKALRICSSELNCGDCPLLYRDSCSSDELMADAATAIEALLESVGMLDEQRSYWIDKAAEYYNQLPKRGEWKKISQHKDSTSDYECSVCLGIIEDVPDDDEHPLVAYCPMCGAKMEVPDETEI